MANGRRIASAKTRRMRSMRIITFHEEPGVTGRFVLDDKGQVAQVVVVHNGREMRAKKQP
jgi:hypothetical protein